MPRLVEYLKRPMVALAIIAAFAGGLRFYNLGHPAERIFDEAYYSKDGCLYAGHSYKECDIRNSGERYWVITRASDRGETSWVHPQLGKWAIALGILGEGNTPFGWRVATAAAGTATVVITAAIAWLLFGSILWTYVSGLLLATETLNFVQSRTSMLDIFLAFWVLLGFLFLIFDRRWIERRTEAAARGAEPALSPGPGAMAIDEDIAWATPARPEAVPSPIWRPWRFAAGFAFGAATATKWSGALALVAAALLAFLWEVQRRRSAGVPTGRAVWKTVQLELLGGLLAFVVVPIAVYLASYTRYFTFQSWHSFWEMQRAAFRFHHSELPYLNSAGQHTHPYESKPWTWLAMLRPVSYYYASPGGRGSAAEVLAMGHPLLFWGSIVMIPVVAWRWIQRQDWRAGLIVVAILVQYLPWFLAAQEVQFLFYMTPITPFLVLGTVYALKDLCELRSPEGGTFTYVPALWVYLFIYVATFAFFYPVLVGWHMSYVAWHWRMWMPSWI